MLLNGVLTVAKKKRPPKTKSKEVSVTSNRRSETTSHRARVAEVIGEDHKESYMEASAYKGPVPAPEDLDKYEILLPGSADRLISMAERESAHRHEIEKKLVNASITDNDNEASYRTRGQIFAFIIALSAMGAGVYLAKLGVPGWGTILGLSGVAVLVWPFINRFKGIGKDN